MKCSGQTKISCQELELRIPMLLLRRLNSNSLPGPLYKPQFCMVIADLRRHHRNPKATNLRRTSLRRPRRVRERSYPSNYLTVKTRIIFPRRKRISCQAHARKGQSHKRTHRRKINRAPKMRSISLS